MKHRFWLFKRQGIFYAEDTFTGKQETLGTRDRKEAERLRATKNDAAAQRDDPPGGCAVAPASRMPEGSRGSSEAIPPVRHGKDSHLSPDIS